MPLTITISVNKKIRVLAVTRYGYFITIKVRIGTHACMLGVVFDTSRVLLGSQPTDVP